MKMPVAVMAAAATGAFSYRKLLEQCETQELEVKAAARAGGFLSPVVTPLLLPGPGPNGRLSTRRRVEAPPGFPASGILGSRVPGTCLGPGLGP